jgi:phosphatidylinositol glycan class B
MTISVKQILGIGLILFSITAYTSEGYHHSDEHWQLVEFANYKLGRYPQQNLASEYSKEMRSAFQPGIAYVAIQSLEAIGITNPFYSAFVLRLVSCVLGWLVLAIVVVNCAKLGVPEKHQKLVAIISMFLWFTPYLVCRFSNENWSGIFFCFGLLAIALNDSSSFKYYFLSGLLVGISYLCRFQIAFALIGLLAWLVFIQRASFFMLLSFAIAFIFMIRLRLTIISMPTLLKVLLQALAYRLGITISFLFLKVQQRPSVCLFL